MKKYFSIVFFVFLYVICNVYLLLSADTHEVIYLSLNSDYEVNTGTRVYPFPGRRLLAEYRLRNIDMKLILGSRAFTKTLYPVFYLARNSSVDASGDIAIRIVDDFIFRGYPVNRADEQGCDSIRDAIIWKDKFAVRYFMSKGYDFPSEGGKYHLCEKSVSELLELYIPDMVDELSQGGAASEAAHPKPATR